MTKTTGQELLIDHELGDSLGETGLYGQDSVRAPQPIETAQQDNLSAGLHGVAEESGRLVLGLGGDTDAEMPGSALVPLQRLGVLKRTANYDGDSNRRVGVDGLEFQDDEQTLGRMIRHFSGSKDKRLQSLLGGAIDFIFQNPQGDGSRTIRGLDKGQGTPMFNNERVQFWRFKPNEAEGLKHDPAIRNVRIVYGVIELPDGQKALGIIDIINREDLEKKYN